MHGREGVLELDQHVPVLLDYARAVVGHRDRSDAILHGFEQHPVQLGVVDRVVRDVVAGAATARLREDALPMAGEECELLLLHRDRPQRVLESEVDERADRVREQVDAHAERGVGRRTLIDAAVDPGAFELKRQAEPADAAADDGHVHRQRTGT
jgi:hypothetical protein